jgi:hypothetical protein
LTGQPNLAIDPGAVRFTFPDRVESGAPYDVTIVSQPTPQRCEVLRGAGTVGAADVEDVEIVCDPVALVEIDVPAVQVAAGGTVTFAATLVPGNSSNTALTWAVCTAPANGPGDCAPAQAATHGTITGTGEYTAPNSVAASPQRVHVLACQGAICAASHVDVYAGASIDAFTVTPRTINWDDHDGTVAASWSVRDATRVALIYPSMSVVDVTGRTSFQMPWSQGGAFTLTASNPGSPVDASRTVTVWVNPVTMTPTQVAGRGYLSPDGQTLICDFDVAYRNTGGEKASFSGFRLSSDGGATYGAVTPLPWSLEASETTRWLWTYFGTPGQSFTQVTEEHYSVPSNPTTFTLRRTITCAP